MKHTHLIWICIIAMLLCCGLMVGGAQALTWTSASGCWTATDGTYNYSMWNATGVNQWTVPLGFINGQYLIIGGAGSGAGSASGGGGGAGGYLNGTSLSLTPGTVINATVGEGGLGSTGDHRGNPGNDTVFGPHTAKGGGYGGGYTEGGNGGNGGSGGGAGGVATPGTYNGGHNTTGQGYYGGNITADGTHYLGGGGGGASAVGSKGSGTTSGNGGDGYSNNITGTPTDYASGGGGGGYTGTTAGAGGLTDGGAGSSTGNGGNGLNGRGSGGGGAKSSSYTGGNGGSGVIILKYTVSLTPVSAFTPTGVTTGLSPLTVTFNDTSTNTPTYGNYTYQGYGSNTTLGYNFSTSLNTTAVFTAGNFSISHGAGNAAGFNLSTQATWVNVTPSATIPIAISSLSRAAMQAGSYLWYNDTSLNTPTAWNWTFGDGTYSSVANGSKTYYRRGIYNVSSNVSNSAGSNTSYNIIRVV